MAGDFKYSYKIEQREELSLVVYNVGFQKCTPGYRWGPGVRDHYLLHYILSGKGTYKTGDKIYTLEAGQLFLAPPETTIYYCADEEDPWEYYWVGFSGPAAKILLAQMPFNRKKPIWRPAEGELFRQRLLDIYNNRGSDYPAALRMAGYLQVALSTLLESSVKQKEDSLEEYARSGAAFLQQNYSADVSIEDVAQNVGVSRSYLYRAFQKEFGCSPSVYLTNYRIQRAMQLLRHSSLAVSVIAISVGFDDPLYFSRVFRRATGLSPTEYRTKKVDS